MKTTTMKPANLLLLLLLLACSADSRPGSGDPGQNMYPVTLTTSAPRQDLALSPLLGGPVTLTLRITGIDDPSLQAFSVGASVVWSAPGAGPIEETIGSITPFPATQPGSFDLGVPEAARRMLARSDGRLSLRLALQPIAADRPLPDPLRVTLADPAWR